MACASATPSWRGTRKPLLLQTISTSLTRQRKWSRISLPSTRQLRIRIISTLISGIRMTRLRRTRGWVEDEWAMMENWLIGCLFGNDEIGYCGVDDMILALWRSG